MAEMNNKERASRLADEQRRMFDHFTDERLERMIGGTEGRSRKVAEDPDLLNNLLKGVRRVAEWVEDNMGDLPVIGQLIRNVAVILLLMDDYRTGVYTEVPSKTITALVFALTYFVYPVDLIPDVIPVLGMLDDAAVVAGCLKMAEEDIRRYNEWRTEQSSKDTAA